MQARKIKRKRYKRKNIEGENNRSKGTLNSDFMGRVLSQFMKPYVNRDCIKYVRGRILKTKLSGSVFQLQSMPLYKNVRMLNTVIKLHILYTGNM